MTEAIEPTGLAGLAGISANRLLDGCRKGEFSPLDATRAALERAEQLQPVVNAFARIDADSALAQARESAERWRRGEPAGMVDGVLTDADGLPVGMRIVAARHRDVLVLRTARALEEALGPVEARRP